MGGGSSTTTQKPIPWGPQQPHLERTFSEGQRLYEGGPQRYYPGQTYADPTSGMQGMFGGAQNALGQRGLSDAAGSYTQDVLGGQYMDPSTNPYLRQTFQQGAEDVTGAFNRAVLPGIESRFQGAGRSSDSGAYGNALGQAGEGLANQLQRMATGIYGGNYQAERGRQTAAQQMAPSIAGMEGQRLAGLSPILQQQQMMAERGPQESLNRYNFGQQAPWQNLSMYKEAIGGAGGPILGSSGTSEGGGMGGGQIAMGIMGAIAPLLAAII